MEKPTNVPEKGFYYHYKHDPAGPVNNYAYEVTGLGSHTEDNIWMVIYRPLYDSFVYYMGKFSDVRPLTMFMENVTKDGKTFPRFTRITDENTLTYLRGIKRQMYGP